MSDPRAFPTVLFDQAGLNRQHVFTIDALPEAVRSTLGDTENFRQLILLGHGGKHLWRCVQAAGMAGENPIDDYVVQTVAQIFAEHFADKKYRKRPCISACPAGAVSIEAFALDKCIAYRQQDGSACQFTCLARSACPVGSGHRYSEAQLRHTYGISLRMIRR